MTAGPQRAKVQKWIPAPVRLNLEALFVGRARRPRLHRSRMPSPRPRSAKRQLELPLVEPIIPVERPTAWNHPDWLFEPKHDGFRGLAYITPQGCTISSKRGHFQAVRSTRRSTLVEGRHLRALPLTRRKQHLESVLPYEHPQVFRSMTVEEHGLALFEAVMRMDLEGIVAKRKADPYGPASAGYRVLNPEYSQREGRGERFERRR